MKKKIKIEYPLSPVSGSVIWEAVSTPVGLSRWFADNVDRDKKRYTFRWGKTECRFADMTNSRSESFIRFHWCDDEEPKTFFEFKLHYDELTGDHSLEVTDFTDPDEEEDTISLWDSQIDVLKRVCGI